MTNFFTLLPLIKKQNMRNQKILIGVSAVVVLFSGWWIWKSQIPHPPTFPSFESLETCENDFDCQCCDIVGIHKGHPFYGSFEKIHTNSCINKKYLDK